VIDIRSGNGPIPPPAILSQIPKLHFWVLTFVGSLTRAYRATLK
jgi:hypothetical protein